MTQVPPIQARPARYGDVNQLVRFCKAHHDRSDWGHLPFSATKLRESLCHMIRTDGMDVLIGLEGEKIRAALFATLDQFFMNNLHYATDVHFVADKGGGAVLRAFFDWAKDLDAECCIMAIATTDPEGRVGRFYQLAGMKKVGDAWVKQLRERPAQEVAA